MLNFLLLFFAPRIAAECVLLRFVRPHVLFSVYQAMDPLTELPPWQNRTPDHADIFWRARLWVRLRLLGNPRDKGIEFRRGRSPSFHSVVERNLTDLGRRDVRC